MNHEPQFETRSSLHLSTGAVFPKHLVGYKLLKHDLKRFAFKIYKRINRSGTMLLSRKERYAVIIIKKLLSDSKTDLLLHPSENRFYIKNDKEKIFAVVESSPTEIDITVDKVLCFNVRLCERCHDRIHDMFIEEVEKRRMEMELEYTKNIQYSLMTVAHNILKS